MGGSKCVIPKGLSPGAGGLLTGPSGYNNPQFVMRVRQPVTECFVVLTQNMGEGGDDDLCFIMCAVLKPEGGGKVTRRLRRPIKSEEVVKHTGAPEDQREVSLEFERLEEGYYIIMMCTYYPNEVNGFTLRVHTPKGNAVEVKPLGN